MNDDHWRYRALHVRVGAGCTHVSVSPNGTQLCLDFNRHDGSGRELVFGTLNDALVFVEHRVVDVTQHRFGTAAVDDDGAALWVNHGVMHKLGVDGAVRTGPVEGWDSLGIHVLPLGQVPRALPVGSFAVLSSDKRWLAVDNPKRGSVGVFATADFQEVKVLAKLQMVSDFSRDGTLVAVLSKKQIEIRAVEKWKKLVVIPFQAGKVCFSPDAQRLAVFQDVAPCVTIFDVATGNKLSEYPHAMYVRAPVWVSDDVIVFNNGVLEVPTAR